MPTTGNIKQEKRSKDKDLTLKAFEIYRIQINKKFVDSLNITVSLKVAMPSQLGTISTGQIHSKEAQGENH